MKELLSAKVLGMIGIPGAIALYLVYWLTSGVATSAQVSAVEAKVGLHSEQTETQLRLLRLICISTAKSDGVAAECTR